MCCENDVHMLNGRLYDDADGNITCISNEGKSLVDYIIASTSLFDKCTYFCIGTQYFSDHFPLYVHYNYMHLTWVYQIVIIMRILLAVRTNTKKKDTLNMDFLNKFRHLYSDFGNNLQYNQTNILDLQVH